MASRDLTKGAALPPGAANVEDDVKAFEAEERRAKLRLMAARLVLAIVILAVWEYGTDRWFDALWFSSPLRVARHFLNWIQDDLISHLVITLRECFIGYTAGTLMGIFAGALLARFSFLGKMLDPFILALNGIPRIALAPLFIIWFGIGEPSKIVLAGLLSFFLCFYATLSGLRSVEPAVRKQAGTSASWDGTHGQPRSRERSEQRQPCAAAGSHRIAVDERPGHALACVRTDLGQARPGG